MSAFPLNSAYRPDPAFLALGEGFADRVKAADFPETILRWRNDKAATQIGLDQLSDAQWIAHFGRFEALPDNIPDPLALRYHGHQFGVYNPDLGDGRGFLFAQMRDQAGRLIDLGTKGSGTTPWSRQGDGRLTLKGAVRELLATEMLEALGVNTSKTFSIIETGEALMRGDEPSPTRSAVLVRMSHGHVRIGSFQRLAALEEHDRLAQLARYCLHQYYDVPAQDIAGMEDASIALALLGHVVQRTADLAASYMVAGFVHGVLNSDNINISGESFDYGPWRFTPLWEPGFTAAYFDHQGRYAFGRQPEAIHWNAAQLAISLRQLSDAEPLIEKLEQFGPLYQAAVARRFLWRLGVTSAGEAADRALVTAAEQYMTQLSVPIDRFFFDWRGQKPVPSEHSDSAPHQNLVTALAAHPPVAPSSHPYWSQSAPESLHIDEVESIWSSIADSDSWEPVTQKVQQIRKMGQALSESGTIMSI